MLCRSSDLLEIFNHAKPVDLLECLGLSAFAIDVLPGRTLRFAAANAGFAELAEFDATIAGRRSADVFPAEASDEIESYCQRSIDTRRPVNWHWQLPFAGATRWWSTNLAPQSDRTGHIIRLIGIGIGIDIIILKDNESARRASGGHYGRGGNRPLDAQSDGDAASEWALSFAGRSSTRMEAASGPSRRQMGGHASHSRCH